MSTAKSNTKHADQKNRAAQTSLTDTNDNGAIKDPAEWTTGDEPMTGAQESYVHTLARKAGEEVPDEMTKAEASMKIDELREKTGVAEDAKPKRKTARK